MNADLGARLRGREFSRDGNFPGWDNPTAEQAASELNAFEEKWVGKHALIARARRAWQEVIAFPAFDPAIRKIIDTTNARESLNRVIRNPLK